MKWITVCEIWFVDSMSRDQTCYCCDSLTVLAVILSPCEQSPFFSIDTLDKKGLWKNCGLSTAYCGLRLDRRFLQKVNAHTAKTSFIQTDWPKLWGCGGYNEMTRFMQSLFFFLWLHLLLFCINWCSSVLLCRKVYAMYLLCFIDLKSNNFIALANTTWPFVDAC